MILTLRTRLTLFFIVKADSSNLKIIAEYLDKANALTPESNYQEKAKAKFPKIEQTITDYKVIERSNGYTLCEFSLQTGRTHQIRAHLAFCGHFIIGDGKGNWAQATGRYIDDKTIELWANTIKKPVAVRYDWADYPNGNIYGVNGLPVVPFATDKKPGE